MKALGFIFGVLFFFMFNSALKFTTLKNTTVRVRFRFSNALKPKTNSVLSIKQREVFLF